MGTQTIHNVSHSVKMAAAILFLQDDHRRNRRVFKPRLENLDTLRDFEVKNRYRLTREMIGEVHNLIEADIAAQTHRSNPVPTMTKVFNCFNNVLIKKLFRKYVDKNLHLL